MRTNPVSMGALACSRHLRTLEGQITSDKPTYEGQDSSDISGDGPVLLSEQWTG